MKYISIINLIKKLELFWINKCNCILLYPYDIEVGAATSHPLIFFNLIKLKPISYIYTQKSRRPSDSRFINTKLYSHIQFQVVINPIPENIKNIYLDSLTFIGINNNKNDIKFIDDNWENPTLGAWGYGWEIQLNCIEISQFTYFQYMGGIKCLPTIEITYGIERISLFIQNKYNIYDLIWDYNDNYIMKYKDIFIENKDILYYISYDLNSKNILKYMYLIEKEINYLIDKKNIIIPIYDYILKLINYFNILDSRNFFSIFERQKYIYKIQSLSKLLSNKYLNINNE